MKKFILKADIETTDPKKIEALLLDLVGVDGVMRTDRGFKVTTTIEGENARELNRSLLLSLRRVSQGTTLRAEWSHDGRTERFFDSE